MDKELIKDAVWESVRDSMKMDQTFNPLRELPLAIAAALEEYDRQQMKDET